jgi:fatty acid desaturase
LIGRHPYRPLLFGESLDQVAQNAENSLEDNAQCGDIPKDGPPEMVTADTLPIEGDTGHRSVGYYRSILTKDLDPSVFRANPARLALYFFYQFSAIGLFIAIVQLNFSWPVKLICGLLIGFCNGSLGFICHELLHGSIIKSQGLQNFLGFFGTLPYLVSPTYWRYSHNRLHHGKTQQLSRDPDAFPNLRIYKTSRFMKFMFPYTPGSKHKRSSLYFFFWFSFHNFMAQVHMRFRNSIFSDLNHRRANLELAGQLTIAVGLLIYAGPSNWLWVAVVPTMVQNYLLMSYIATNHNLSPLTTKNDPLINSLSVSNHPVLEFLHLNFGYHVEHHIFPAVSGSHIKAVHFALKKHFPKEYLIVPKWQAMRALYSSARIYKNANELVHPESGATFPTLRGDA